MDLHLPRRRAWSLKQRASGRIPPWVDASRAGGRYLAAMTSVPGRPSGSTALQAATLALAIDTLAWPLLLLHGDAVLLHANRAATTLLRRGRPLQLAPHQQVQPTDEAQHSAFKAALLTVLEGAAPVRLHWAGDDGQPATSARLSALRPNPGQDPVLMLTLAPEAGLGADLTAYAAAHGLSATETRVLQRLALGESSARAAVVLGLRATTVRTHALNLRRKTGHASLGSLVHALARLAPIAPLAPLTSFAPIAPRTPGAPPSGFR